MVAGPLGCLAIIDEKYFNISQHHGHTKSGPVFTIKSQAMCCCLGCVVSVGEMSITPWMFGGTCVSCNHRFVKEDGITIHCGRSPVKRVGHFANCPTPIRERNNGIDAVNM